jgi:hypothetical protein
MGDNAAADDARLRALEEKVQELETLVNLALRLLAVQRPVSILLERYGASESEEAAIHALLDELVSRAARGGIETPSFAGFVYQLEARFPSIRGDHDFVALLLDALRLDRAAYQRLHAYTVAHGWPPSDRQAPT